ncbi:MAG: hypothetical protein EA428_12350 [Spirochaetaceae bacterium]|nr:MAG: hypothetical protein EA428_12350 [Spirochaetaceae bacterium]
MRNLVKVILMVSLVLGTVVILPAQEEPNNQNGLDFAGTWERVQGEVRWEWNIEGATYTFTYHREEAFRIGSRGVLELDEEGLLQVTAEEISEDGEDWSNIDMEPEDRTRAYGLEVTQTRMRMSKPDYPQFMVEYSRYMPDENNNNNADNIE